MTWIKICGITNLEDARTAVDAGADALGFVFYEKSPRFIDPAAARKIIEQLPPEIEKVGVFVNPVRERVLGVVRASKLTAVQLWQDSSEAAVADEILRADEFEWLKIIPVCSARTLNESTGIGIMHHSSRKGRCYAIMVDSGANGMPGGTGVRFDWQGASQGITLLSRLKPIVVAGGLRPENVVEAIAVLHPFGVDVSSGVEASPGKKDPQKVRDFISAVRHAEKSA